MSDHQPLPIPTSPPPPKRPRWPWFKDEKVFGLITNATVLRVAAVAVVLAMCLMGWAVFIVLNKAAQVQSDQQQGHISRVKEENAIKKELTKLKKSSEQGDARDLACFVLVYFRRQSGTALPRKGFVKYLNDRYDCTHYEPSIPFTPGTSQTPTPSSRPHSLPSPGGTAPAARRAIVASTGGPTIVVSGGGGPNPRPTATVVRTVPGPRPSATPTPRPTSSSRPPPRSSPTPKPSPTSSTPSRSALCSVTNLILGICLLP